jgi:hypothetical protein
MGNTAIDYGAESAALHATRLRIKIGEWERKLRALPAGDPGRSAIRGTIERLQQELIPVFDCLAEDG